MGLAFSRGLPEHERCGRVAEEAVGIRLGQRGEVGGRSEIRHKEEAAIEIGADELGIVEAVEKKRFKLTAADTSYNVPWIAALGIAARDPWPEVDDWLAGTNLSNLEWRLDMDAGDRAQQRNSAADHGLTEHANDAIFVRPLYVPAEIDRRRRDMDAPAFGSGGE